jgi:hypothetical protein
MAGKKMRQESFEAMGQDISVLTTGGDDDYMSLTDLARQKVGEDGDPSDAIKNWMRNRNTIEFLGIWEGLNNLHFKPVEFDGFKKQAGLNSFVLSPTKWINATNAIGIRVKRGRYGSGTFAHIDIAMDFAAWISPEFRLWVFQEYKRLKYDESSRLSLGWNEKRIFASMNYKLHTDAIKDELVPHLSGSQKKFVYANEADVLNVAFFGMTAKRWKELNPDSDGNIRDHASTAQLLVLSNLESFNATFIREGLDRDERMRKLNEIAIQQMKTFADDERLEGMDDAAQIS